MVQKGRGELVHFDMKLRQFLPFLSGYLGDRSNFLKGWNVGGLYVVS